MDPSPAGHPGSGPAPAPRRGKRGLVIGAIVVVVICAGLCGIGQLITNIINQDDWDNLGEPVPASAQAASPVPSWSRPNLLSAAPVAQIRHQLETWVLASAGVARPTSSTCDQADYTGRQAATLTCTVTYDGHDVVYTVSATPAGNAVFKWEADTKETVVTREGLLALVAGRYGGNGWKNLRCEQFPDVAVVPVGTALSQSCYAKLDGRIKTSRIKIAPTSRGEPGLETEHQEEGLG